MGKYDGIKILTFAFIGALIGALALAFVKGFQPIQNFIQSIGTAVGGTTVVGLFAVDAAGLFFALLLITVAMIYLGYMKLSK